MTDFGEKRVFLVILFTSFSGSLVSGIPGAVQDEDWDYACDAALGGSDCSYTIPVEWLELAVEQGFQEFRLRMSETKIKLVTK